jgi:hypothetical protein
MLPRSAEIINFKPAAAIVYLWRLSLSLINHTLSVPIIFFLEGLFLTPEFKT